MVVLCALLPLVIAAASATALPVNTNVVNGSPFGEIADVVSQIDASRLQSTVETLVSFGTRNTFSGDTGIVAAGQWIHDTFASFGAPLDVQFDRFDAVVNGRDVSIVNVLATLPGYDPTDTRVVLLSGHYDSRASNTTDGESAAPGANDDATGTAVTIEAARVLVANAATAQLRLPCTVVFATFAAEEQGLIGSAHVAERYAAQGVNLVAMLNNDIVGGALFSSETGLRDNVHVRLFSETGSAQDGLEDDSPQRQLARYVKDVADLYVDQLEAVLVYRRDRYLRGGDQTSFTALGFNAIRITEMNENHVWQHQDVREVDGVQYGDLPEHVDFGYVKKVAQMNVAAAVAIALAPGSPASAELNMAQLSNQAHIQWTYPPASEGRDRVAGFVVLRRQTDASQWEWASRLFVNTTEAVLPYSVDNFLFAVQAVDSEGHASIAIPVR